MDVNEELKFLGKFKKNGGSGRVWGGRVRGGQDGCERRNKVFVEIQTKKIGGGGGSGGSGGGRIGGGGLGWM